MARCSYCSRDFKDRGIKRHLRHCKRKPTPESCAYKFCVLNEQITEYVLTFLSNQSVTKLQSFTGDHYPNSDPRLAAVCCSCENDVPVINNGLCTACEKEIARNYKTHMTKTQAKELYWLRDFEGIPCLERRYYFLYARKQLDEDIIVKRKDRIAKLAASLLERSRQYKEFLRTMPEEFSKYLGYIDYKLTTYNTSATEGRAARHASLKAALDQRGIPLNADSHVNRSFIVHGQGSLESTVNTAEEKHFLFTHTKYYQRCEDKIAEFRGTNPRWYRRYE
ncbi:hypothetical protein GQ600_16757 [Phytophthora cactorum]|nr:hypothetical protein GQ600_16757 [Phytophthora cactorum]